jgi:hypothetical protein
MNLSIILFLIGILGFILNRKNIILLIISIEIMLLAVNKANLQFIFCFIPIIITSALVVPSSSSSTILYDWWMNSCSWKAFLKLPGTVA